MADAGLADAGHQAIPTPSSADLDVDDHAAVERAVREARPEAVAHLAAIASRRVAASDPDRTDRVNVGGTRHVLEAARAVSASIPVLVASSSEVYASGPADGPLGESAVVATDGDAYSRSKLAAEAVALEARRQGQRVVITRAFNHTGPGQSDSYAIPAFARRVVAAIRPRRGRDRRRNVSWSATSGTSAMSSSPTGSLLESWPTIASSEASSMSQRVARSGCGPSSRSSAGSRGIEVRIHRDESPCARASPTGSSATRPCSAMRPGWRPSRTLDETLADVYADVAQA